MTNYRPKKGFLLDKPLKRIRPKSAFLRRLERMQREATEQVSDENVEQLLQQPRPAVPVAPSAKVAVLRPKRRRAHQ